MHNIPALCAFLLCLPLTAWPQSTPPDAAGREVFTDSASAVCAAWGQPALKPGGERMRRLLEALELDAYVSARHGGTGFNPRDLDALLARVERICAAHPERGLAEVWREQKKTWHRGPWKTTMTRCRDILAAGDHNEDAFFFGIWLYAYDQARDGSNIGEALRDMPAGAAELVWKECARTPDAPLLGVLRRMQGK